MTYRVAAQLKNNPGLESFGFRLGSAIKMGTSKYVKSIFLTLYKTYNLILSMDARDLLILLLRPRPTSASSSPSAS